MKKLALLVAVATISSMASAVVIVSDDFNDGNLDNWHQKWTATQNGLFTNTGTEGNLSGLMEDQYRMLRTDGGFSLTGSEVGYLRSDFQMDHTGAAPIAANLNAFGFLLTTTPTWFDGANQVWALANRGAAVGNRIPFAPWVEGWMDWNAAFGIDPNVGGLGSWFDMEMEVTISGGTYWGQVTVNHDAGSYTSSAVDLGIAAGTIVYPGYSSGWTGQTTNRVATASLNQVNVDNFEVEVIPEPASLALIGLAGLSLFIRRRFRG